MEKLEPVPLAKSEEENPVKKRDFYVLTASVNDIIDWIHAHEKDYKSWRSLIRVIANDIIRTHNKEKHWKK